jgi:diguanylate cyclase (GGDEF)-like protein
MEWAFRDLILNYESDERPIAFIALDLDSFKIINDSNGHVAGDYVLKTISELLTECSCPDDLVFRYGGDEFVIILPGESALSALGTASRIAASIRRWAKSSTIPEAESLGASIGITEVNSSEDTLKVLMTYADEALYRAKELGKGRIVVNPRHRSADPEGSTDGRRQS